MHPFRGLFTVAVLAAGPLFGTGVVDTFQSYALGTFPSPVWSDVGAVLPHAPFIPPLPSATVIATTDAFGNPTKALATVNALGNSKGIFAAVPVNNFYSLFADLRVDQYSDNSAGTSADWAMQITFAQAGVNNFDTTPQAGVYASSFTRGWRLFLISSNGGPGLDLDLGVAANIGQWYHVLFEANALTGAFHSRIVDVFSNNLLVDRIDTVAGWQPQFAQFDSVAFFSGELSNDTVANIGVVDNINASSSVPEPGGAVLLSIAVGIIVRWRRLGRR